ncbi:MAG: biotin transporter BioY [Firmicutes bacterium]|nr:biotin transporter BioY [Bacillota bacterium]MCL5038477.1 biotin transporter BioY [Bacillota bacterium]
MRTYDVILAGLFAALTAVGARLSLVLPAVTGVPFSLQVLFVLLSGALLGPVAGAVSQLSYLLLGAMGLPVFARGTAGLGILLGPTGGYLLSYPLAAFLVGWVSHRRAAPGRGGRYWFSDAGRWGGFLALFSGMAAALAVIYSLGLAQFLHYSFSQGKAMGMKEALALTVLPFIGFDLGKALLAAWLARRIRRALGARHSN